MIRIFKLVFLLTFAYSISIAQNKYTDSLKRELILAKNDTSRVLLMADLGFFYRFSNIDSSTFYSSSALALAEQVKFLRGKANALDVLGLTMREKGDLPKSLELQFNALKIAEDNNYPLEKSNCLRRIGLVYLDLKDFPRTVSYFQGALKNSLLIQDKHGEAYVYANLSDAYRQMNDLDSALYYGQKALKEINYMEDVAPDVYRTLGDIQAEQDNRQSALSSYREGIRVGLLVNDFRTISFIYANMAELYKQMNQQDSSIVCAINGLKYGQIVSYKKGILLSANLLSQLYDSINPKEALRYYKIAASAKDSLFGAGNIQTIQTIITRENERQKEVEAANAAYRNRLKQYSLLTGLGVFFVIAILLYRNNRQKQKANLLLQQQKEKVESTLTELKSTQAQLIQSEKMASLGELTAGIAHEIQNPLNFVNNFSEVNAELIDELEQEIKKGNFDDIKIIAKDLKDNEQKILHHGKRADAIVKGMLQHSRVSTGQKEPTDINRLADEYLRLSYHGMRAKDKSFNATLQTDFDESIGKVKAVPQDIGRVLLNLFNNALYATNEKKKTADETYQPTISVETKKLNSQIEIRVADNGNGIPQNIVDKIFQPFFTTKPTGQGTGLGLSLSYDIIKAHGGEIKVETKGEAGVEFIVQLPTT